MGFGKKCFFIYKEMCGFSKKYDKDEFIRRANIIHNNIYDYILSDYKNSRDKIEITYQDNIDDRMREIIKN